MAAIDKIYVKCYEDYDYFRVWCIAYKPSLLLDFYNPLGYNYNNWPGSEEKEIPITNFRTKQDRWLLWHCPIDFVRDYLEKNCGYKTRWYHKLFFKE